MKQRLDQAMVAQKLVRSRSEAESWIKLGKVVVDGRVVQKPGHFVGETAQIVLAASERFVSRAGLKLASVATLLGVEFAGKTVLDVGSSTGGFTDFALQNGAKKVIAVDVGTDQLHPSLRNDTRIELHEKTDIRNVFTFPTPQKVVPSKGGDDVILGERPDIVVMDVSFISLREILPHIATLCSPHTQVVAMLKPQFEAGRHQVNKGVIKNDSVRREILKEFELWVKQYYVILDKSDSEVAGSKGNKERFYLLQTIR